jgi:nucleoside-diphosphate-sugar epimerase
VRVFVTGASGFLGRALVARLAGDGHEVWCLARGRDAADALARGGAQAAHGDLGDGDAVMAAVERARPDAVVHLAAEIATQRSSRRLHEVNVGGTRNLLHACLEGAGAGAPPHLLFASTVVTGDAGGAVLTEETPLNLATVYGRSKHDAERMLLGACCERGLPLTVIRPSHVYGPGGWYGQIVHEVARGRFFIPGDGRNLWDVVHVDDVAEAFRLALARRPEPGAAAVYHVADDTPVTFNDFVGHTAAALGVRPPRHVPRMVAALVAGRGPVAAAVRSARSSNARIKSDLGWAPRWPDSAAAIPGVVAAIRAAWSPGPAPAG